MSAPLIWYFVLEHILNAVLCELLYGPIAVITMIVVHMVPQIFVGCSLVVPVQQFKIPVWSRYCMMSWMLSPSWPFSGVLLLLLWRCPVPDTIPDTCGAAVRSRL